MNRIGIFASTALVALAARDAEASPLRAMDALSRAPRACMLLMAQQTFAPVKSARSEFVQVEANKKLYVRYIEPQAGKPTLVFINGLTHRLENWDFIANDFERAGYGVLRYDPVGQGQTLAKYGPVLEKVDYKDQVRDLALLLDALKIRSKVSVVGLSYGGALALEFASQYPERIAHLVAMAPFLAPLKTQDAQITSMIEAHVKWVDWVKTFFPAINYWVGPAPSSTVPTNANGKREWLGQMQAYWLSMMKIFWPFFLRDYDPRNPQTQEQLYDTFLSTIVYLTYPSAEVQILEHPYKLEATFRMAQGIRKFMASDIAGKLPDSALHLMVANQDQYIPRTEFTDFWKLVPERSRMSVIYIEGAEHKMNQAFPWYASAWIKLIVDGDPRIAKGSEFNGSVFTNTAETQTATIDLEKVW